MSFSSTHISELATTDDLMCIFSDIFLCTHWVSLNLSCSLVSMTLIFHYLLSLPLPTFQEHVKAPFLWHFKQWHLLWSLCLILIQTIYLYHTLYDHVDAHSKQPCISWFLHSLYFLVILRNFKSGFQTAIWLSLLGNPMLYGRSHNIKLKRKFLFYLILSCATLSIRTLASFLRLTAVTKSYQFYLLNNSPTLLSSLVLNALTHNILHYNCLLIGFSASNQALFQSIFNCAARGVFLKCKYKNKTFLKNLSRILSCPQREFRTLDWPYKTSGLVPT